jgi:hypothetical protein
MQDLSTSEVKDVRNTAMEYLNPSVVALDQSDLNAYGIDMSDGRDRRGRKENGLVELTKKFIDLLKKADC